MARETVELSEIAERPADTVRQLAGEATMPAPPAAPAPGIAGHPAPHFTVASSRNPQFAFSSLGGRYVALCFLGPVSELGLNAVRQARESGLFRDESFAVMATVSTEARDQAQLLEEMAPYCVFWDHDLAVSRRYGAVPADAVPHVRHIFNAHWLLLDPMLRTLLRLPLSETPAFLERVRALPPVALHAGTTLSAPVLTMPRIFEPEFCRALIEMYRTGDSTESGFMVERGGKTVGIYDHSFKRRRDLSINNPSFVAGIRHRLRQRLFPEIARAFQFRATHIERYIVACYEGGGFFGAHRDNKSAGTAHRQFAVTINLNAEEYEGGELRFPEFGERTYRAPTGAALVFSCSLLHEALPVTRGVRYACLPFLYDESNAQIRQQNAHLIVDGQPPG